MSTQVSFLIINYGKLLTVYLLTEKCYNSAHFKCSLKHLIPTLSEKPQLAADKSSVCKMKYISSRSADEIVRAV